MQLNITWAAVTVAVAVLLTACGGGADVATTVPSALKTAMVSNAESRPLVPVIKTAVPGPRPLDATTLFNWAETRFPELFPKGPVNQTADPYLYRYYPSSMIYLGVRGDEVVWLGPNTNNQIVSLGKISDYTCVVFPATCPSFKVTDNSLFVVQPVNTDLTVLPLSGYSHVNAKQYPAQDIVSLIRDIQNQYFPVFAPTWAVGDFMQNGKLTAFVSQQIYFGWDIPFEQAAANPANYSTYEFWELENGKRSKLISSYKSKCLLARKAVVADFNKDGLPDIFVACTGYDAPPFPGEKSELLTNHGNGKFTVTQITDVGYRHGASAADINGDGYPDIVVADTHYNGYFTLPNVKPNVYFLINNGDGTFREDYTILGDPNKTNPFRSQYISIELMDVNSDGTPDIVMGGDNREYNQRPGTFETPTKILYGVGGKFVDSGITVPFDATVSSTQDFTLHKGFLYIGTVNYTAQSNAIQRINLNTYESKIIYRNVSTNTNILGWVAWWIPTKDGLRAWSAHINNDLIPY